MSAPIAKLAAVMLLLDSARGVYIPRDFLTDNDNVPNWDHCEKWGLTQANQVQWLPACNPDHEWYWEAWDWVLNNAEFTCENGHKFKLLQDGDLWAYCYDQMSLEEKVNFGFDVEGEE